MCPWWCSCWESKWNALEPRTAGHMQAEDIHQRMKERSHRGGLTELLLFSNWSSNRPSLWPDRLPVLALLPAKLLCSLQSAVWFPHRNLVPVPEEAQTPPKGKSPDHMQIGPCFFKEPLGVPCGHQGPSQDGMSSPRLLDKILRGVRCGHVPIPKGR